VQQGVYLKKEDHPVYYKLKERVEYRGYPLLLFSNAQGGGNDSVHSHDFFEIALVRSGCTIHCVYGRGNELLQKSTLIRGDLYVIPPGVRHQFQDKRDVLLYTMGFLPELFTEEEFRIVAELPALRELAAGSCHFPRLHLLPLEFAEAERLLRRLMNHLQAPRQEAAHRLMAKSLTLEYLISIGLHAPERWSRAPETADKKILAAIEEMERDPRKLVRIPETARKYGMCASGFSRKFREITGMPPLKYCRFLRLELVRQALTDSNVSVEELAENFGFADGNHLIKLFKKHYAVTPHRFRLSRRADLLKTPRGRDILGGPNNN